LNISSIYIPMTYEITLPKDTLYMKVNHGIEVQIVENYMASYILSLKLEDGTQ